ncbi:MAG: transglutaminaseTgpA domain-containing protein [Acidimicrobiia bacterium]|nr:transglutaminaseTgpA domain-containing protein [Acidimicrobiia bacterium]
MTRAAESSPAVGFCLAGACFVALRHASLRSESRTWFVPRKHPVRWSVSRGLAFGSLAVIVAVAASPLLPGADAEALFDYRGVLDSGGSSLTADNPVVDIRSNLLDFPDTVMFTSDRDAAYYRLTTLDSFDGSTWTFSEQKFTDSGLPEEAFDATNAVRRIQQDYDIEIESLRSSWLPAPYRPVTVLDIDYGTAPDRPDLFVEDGVEQGDSFVVRSVVYEQLDSAALDTILPQSVDLSNYLELPADFPATLTERAQEIVTDAGAVTPYQQARALRAWFRETSGPDRFVYDQEVEAGIGVDSIEQFVLQPVGQGGHTGYCEQFSTSFAALGRAIGLPTRVAVGYLGGTLSDTTGRYEIRGDRSHAWSEVYLEGVGWVPFDATPGNGAGEGAAGDHSVTPIGATSEAPPVTDPSQPPDTGPAATQPATSAPVPEPPPDATTDAGSDAASPGRAPTVVIVVALAVLGVLTLGVVASWSIVAVKRRRRRHRSRRVDARGRVVGAWEEAGDRLLEAGIPPVPHDSPTEFARRVARVAGDAAPPFEHLAENYTEACYSPAMPDESTADAAWRECDAMADALREGLSLTERMRRAVSLQTLRR